MKTTFKLITVLAFLAVLGAILAFVAIGVISLNLPQVGVLKEYRPPIPSKIYSYDGEVLLEAGKERREIVAFEKIPERIVNSFIAAEDDNFFEHEGIDFKGILRATFINLKAGRVVQGASTITQQVAKSLLLTNERTFTRKIKDLLLARKIEKTYTKEEILFLYLNQVYLGGGYYGIKTAFRGYFDKDLEAATIAESALVAGLLVAPGRYSPYINPQYAKKRQNYVLKRLLITKKITQDEYDQAISESIKLHLRKPNPMKGGYFTDWIRQRMVERFGAEEFLTKGFEIKTSLDWKLQQKAEKQVYDGVVKIDKRQGFAGALEHLEDPTDFILKQRQEIIKANSEYFFFNPDATTQLQNDISTELRQKIEQTKEEKLSGRAKWFLRYFFPGNAEQDRLHSFVDTSKYYKAVVRGTSNLQQMIYVTFAGGLEGVIPHENFKWAHPRSIKGERNYWSYVDRPSQIVKKGDVILVKIQNSSRSIKKYISEKFYATVSNKSLREAIEQEKFYILSLEQEPKVQGALVSISNKDGRIITMVGGADFSKSQFNRAVQSNRQPGSSFKPFLFGAGLENGFTPATMILDTPAALGGADSGLSWKPQNYDGKFKGKMTLRRALETSRNIPTIKLVQDVGVKEMKQFIHRFAPQLKLPNDLSISLGAFGINLLELVRLYSVFPNNGKLLKTKSILEIQNAFGEKFSPEQQQSTTLSVESLAMKLKEAQDQERKDKLEQDADDNIFRKDLKGDQVYDERLAFIMNNLLKGVIRNGTGRAARGISPYIGGKTGTTNSYVDAWFVGFAPSITTGVWTGFDDNQTMGFGETGAKSALPVWSKYMQAALKDYGNYDFPTPDGITNVSINPETGELSRASDEKKFLEAFVDGTEPKGGIDVKEQLNTSDEDLLLIDDGYYTDQ